MLTVLCIDDDRQTLGIREVVLRAEGFQVLTAHDGRSGIALANENAIDVVVLDYSMPDMTGEDVARMLRQKNPALPMILCSGYDVPESAFKVVDAFVMKGDVPAFLVMTIKSVIARKKPPSREPRLQQSAQERLPRH